MEDQVWEDLSFKISGVLITIYILALLNMYSENFLDLGQEAFIV